MSIKVEYIGFGGGLDVASSALAVKPGRIASGINFEQVFGKQGYRRIDGYERFDGRLKPSAASYFKLGYDTGTIAFVAGDIVTAGAATARVVTVDGTVASGTLILDNVSGTFADNAAITVSGVTRALVNGAISEGSGVDAQYDAWVALVRTQRRSLIQVVPGSGPVLGVAVYANEVYAIRNVADGSSATMWKSSASGWVSIRSGLYPGGAYQMRTANFSGASTTMALFGVNGRGRLFKYDGTTFTFAAPIFGTEATSLTSNTVGTGAKTFVVGQPTRGWVAGMALTIWSTANSANRMSGTITSYTSGTGTLVMNITSSSGTGTFTDWEMGLSDWNDKPYDLVDYKDHMFLAYPRGQLQTSNLGDPMTYTSSAALFGLGDEITGIVGVAGGVLAVLCANKIDLISGSSVTDWSKQNHSVNSGAIRGTVQPNSGNAVYIDDKGVTTLQATQNWGSFEPAVCSRDVDSFLRSLGAPIGSRLVKSKFQYRAYFSNGTRLTGTILNPVATIQPNDIAFTYQRIEHEPSCFGDGDISDVSSYFFGTTDGYVMQEDSGTSFDGAAIGSAMRLHFNHLKSPSSKKRFRKIVLEMSSAATVTINFKQHFDYSNGTFSPGISTPVVALGGGGAWDSAQWNSFYWSSPVATEAEANADGVGRNMALLFWHESDLDEPFYIQGMLLHYSIYGLQR